MNTLPRIRIGTRKSPLALAQSAMIRQKLMDAWPGLEVELVHITTSGDKFIDQPLADIGGKGLFTKEIEEALLDGSIDLAVHSVKDMQTVLPDGLTLGCVPEREDARDVLVGAVSLAAIPKGASFGTSSLRRSAQVLMQRPDLKMVSIRGNVHTRIAKVEQREVGATLLAKAGLNRLGLLFRPPLEGGQNLRRQIRGGYQKLANRQYDESAGDAILAALSTPPDSLRESAPPQGGGEELNPELELPYSILHTSEILPAVGQGALGIECRDGDKKILDLLAPLSHAPTEASIACERAFLRAVDGSCRMPIAGYATVKTDTLHFEGLIAEPDGRNPRRTSMEGSLKEAVELGRIAGKKLVG